MSQEQDDDVRRYNGQPITAREARAVYVGDEVAAEARHEAVAQAAGIAAAEQALMARGGPVPLADIRAAHGLNAGQMARALGWSEGDVAALERVGAHADPHQLGQYLDVMSLRLIARAAVFDVVRIPIA